LKTISKNPKLPLYLESVKAGFPSPAEDYLDKRLNLQDYVVKHPEATFFVRVSGNSMKDAGIFPGDILVVDRSIEPVDGKIVIAVLNGELTVKRLKKKGEKVFLVPENSEFTEIEVSSNHEFSIWGVVTAVIHLV